MVGSPVAERRVTLCLITLCVLGGCGDNPVMMMQTATLTAAELTNPDTCKTCHATHYQQWAGSMHAYASEDPVFRAMNARGQRETKGALGSFCVSCHAPLAVRSGATTDGLNLDSVEKELHGVTCYFCHTVDEVTDSHNAPLHQGDAVTMRGGISDPFGNTAHHSSYSRLHDRQDPSSASLCGSCHDIVNPLGAAIERTYHEWQGTVYAQPATTTLRTCGKCHMSGTTGAVAEVTGAPTNRLFHDHTIDGIDVALSTFPSTDTQLAAINNDLTTALSARLCVTPAQNDTTIAVTLDNVAIGHGFPSGANQDRRAWVEVIAYQGTNAMYSSGVVQGGSDVTTLVDPSLWLFRDTMLDAAGKPVDMFWEAASYQSSQLAASVTNDPNDPRYYHAVTHNYTAPNQQPDRVTMRVRIRPIAVGVIDDLVQSGDLDASVQGKLPTFDLAGTVLEWKKSNGFGCVPF